jgi:hypothetical protein
MMFYLNVLLALSVFSAGQELGPSPSWRVSNCISSQSNNRIIHTIVPLQKPYISQNYTERLSLADKAFNIIMEGLNTQDHLDGEFFAFYESLFFNLHVEIR